MDKGNLFNHEFEILPMNEGGFVVFLGKQSHDYGRKTTMEHVKSLQHEQRWAFSTVQDLMQWMQGHAEAFASKSTQVSAGSGGVIIGGNLAQTGAVGTQAMDHMIAVRETVSRG